MTKEEKEAVSYARERLSIDDYPVYNDEYELMLAFEAGAESMKEALRMEYEKGRADVLRCIDPDEMVADFCSQPLSKTRSIASVYRQGITDILKRINSNEENSITGTCSIDNCGL